MPELQDKELHRVKVDLRRADRSLTNSDRNMVVFSLDYEENCFEDLSLSIETDAKPSGLRST